MLSGSKISTVVPSMPQQQAQKPAELIVEINIGKKGAKQHISLQHITSISHIETQIRNFMKQQRLKESAFSFIKDIIVRKIVESKEAVPHQAIRQTQHNCNCHNNCRSQEEKQACQFISFDQFNDSFRRSICKLSSITPKRESSRRVGTLQNKNRENISTNIKQEDVSSFVFNSSFTLPSSACDKDRYITDEIFDDVLNVSTNKSGDYFSNMNEFKSKGNTKADRIKLRPSVGELKRSEKPRNIQTSNFYCEENSQENNQQFVSQAAKTNQRKLRTSIPLTITINTPQRKKRSNNMLAERNALTPISVNNLGTSSDKKGYMLSTKQRKQLLMKSRRNKFAEVQKEQQSPSFVLLSSENLQEMVVEQKRLLKEDIPPLSQHSRQQMLPTNTIPEIYQSVLKSLFKKLTAKNPPEFEELHSQYVSYQCLSREELGFMGVLFEKIDYKELNSLNYQTFRKNSLKFCTKELEELSKSFPEANQIFEIEQKVR